MLEKAKLMVLHVIEKMKSGIGRSVGTFTWFFLHCLVIEQA